MPKYDIGTGLPDLPAGLNDEDFNLVAPIYRAVNSLGTNVAAKIGRVSYSASEMALVDPASFLRNDKTHKLIIKAAENLAYGKVVSLSFDGTNYVGHLADALTPKFAHACVDIPGGITSGTFGEVILRGLCTGITGSTVGQFYWLATAGTVSGTQPGYIAWPDTGTKQQCIGYGLGTLGLYFNPSHYEEKVNFIEAGGAGPKGLRKYMSDGLYYDL